MDEITWNDFSKVELRVGRILEVHEFPQARQLAYISFQSFAARAWFIDRA